MMQSDISELDKAYHFYAIMKGKEFEEVETITINKVLNYYKSKNVNIHAIPMYAIYRLGWWFKRLNLNITHNTASDNMAIMAFCSNEDELIENLHKVLATMTRRTHKQRKSGRYFDNLSNRIQNEVNVNVAYSMAVFFLKHYNKDAILQRLTTSLEKITKKLERLRK